jgi:23S rRNA A2030 N6-methylase RlmJ
MENLKPLPEISNPDQRNLMFVRIDTGEPISVEEHYAGIASVVLDPRVPEEVKSYFSTVQNVCFYAWFAYDLYAVVDFLCCTAIEMALRMRFPVHGTDRRGLRALFKKAVGEKLINEKGFEHIRQMRLAAAERLRVERRIMKQSGPWPRNSARQNKTDD